MTGYIFEALRNPDRGGPRLGRALSGLITDSFFPIVLSGRGLWDIQGEVFGPTERGWTTATDAGWLQWALTIIK